MHHVPIKQAIQSDVAAIGLSISVQPINVLPLSIPFILETSGSFQSILYLETSSTQRSMTMSTAAISDRSEAIANIAGRSY
jgi:hypothetical protein